jgi:hypothetical protein
VQARVAWRRRALAHGVVISGGGMRGRVMLKNAWQKSMRSKAWHSLSKIMASIAREIAEISLLRISIILKYQGA